MNVNSSGAVKAYQIAQKILDESSTSSSSASGTSNASGGSGFADMVSDAVKSSVNSVKQSEAISAQAITGQASLTDVVSAVNSADIALKSVVAVRDKVIGAYQDIIKMPI